MKTKKTPKEKAVKTDKAVDVDKFGFKVGSGSNKIMEMVESGKYTTKEIIDKAGTSVGFVFGIYSKVRKAGEFKIEAKHPNKTKVIKNK